MSQISCQMRSTFRIKMLIFIKRMIIFNKTQILLIAHQNISLFFFVIETPRSVILTDKCGNADSFDREIFTM